MDEDTIFPVFSSMSTCELTFLIALQLELDDDEDVLGPRSSVGGNFDFILVFNTFKIQ